MRTIESANKPAKYCFETWIDAEFQIKYFDQSVAMKLSQKHMPDE